MDNQDQRRTHSQGHENHGVHVCHNCGWPFPNPHPSAKHRRAHKKICGTIEGYTLLVSEGQTHFNASDDEHYSDDDHKRQGPKALDIGGNNEISKGGIGENSVRSVDEVFSDAVADFSDGALSPGVKESVRDSLDSATDVEIFQRLYPELSRPFEDNGANDESHSIVKSRNDGQMENPNVVQSERVEDANMLELQGQLLTSTASPLTSSIADLKTEEMNAVLTKDWFDLTSDLNPSRSDAMLDEFLDNKIHIVENVRACNFTSVEEETGLRKKDEIKSDEDMVEIVVSADNAEDETLDGVSKIEDSYLFNSNYLVADRSFNLKKMSNAVFTPPLEADSAASTNASISDIQAELAHTTELATSSDANVHVLTCPSSDERPDVAHPWSEYEDSHINEDDECVVSQKSSSLHSSKALEQDRDDLEDSDTEKNDFLINLGQLSERTEVVLSKDMHTLNGDMKKEQMNCELMTEESIDVFPVTFKVESSKCLDETGTYMNPMKTEMNLSENHIINFSEKVESDDVRKNSQQVNLPESIFMATSNENPSERSFESGASTVISGDGKCNAANTENYSAISMKSLLPSNMHSEIKPSSLCKIEDFVEMVKFENCEIKDTQHTEMSFGKDNPWPATSHFESPIPSVEDVNDDEINSSDRFNEDSNRIASITADSYQAQDGEQLLNPTEGLVRDHSSSSSLNIELPAQHVPATEDTQDGVPGRKVSGVVADPIQDQNVLSVQSDAQAQAAIESEALSSTDLLASTEALESNLKQPSSERQQCESTEMFEPPSFMTLVEPGHVGAKPAESEVQSESNNQHPDLTSSQVGWFPTLTHATNESEGRKRNEEIIAKVTKHNKPLKSLLSEVANSSKPPIPEKKSVNQKNGKVAEDNGSGLTTVNSILGGELPTIQVVKGESEEEWNSQASYASEIKREKKKSKSRPFWIQLMCCSSVEAKSR